MSLESKTSRDREVYVVKVSKKRLIVIPKKIAEKLGISEGSSLEFIVQGDKVCIEPARDAYWYAIHGPRIGYISYEEIEEESMCEQKKFENNS